MTRVFLKKGSHSVGVTRQYCGQLGKQENCRVAVSVSLATTQTSLPATYQLYLPEIWANDAQRRRKAGVPEEVRFQTQASSFTEAAEVVIPAQQPGRTPSCVSLGRKRRDARRPDRGRRLGHPRHIRILSASSPSRSHYRCIGGIGQHYTTRHILVHQRTDLCECNLRLVGTGLLPARRLSDVVAQIVGPDSGRYNW